LGGIQNGGIWVERPFWGTLFPPLRPSRISK